MLFLIVALFVLAIPVNAEICEYFTQDLGINTGATIPRFIPYKNDVFNVYSQNEPIGLMELKNGEIIKIECGKLSEKPTFSIYIKDIDTIKDIFESESPVDEFNNKLKSKDLDIRGNNITSKIKGFFTRLIAGVAGLFL